MQIHDHNLAPRYTFSNSMAGIEQQLAACYPSSMDSPRARNEIRRSALLRLIEQCVPSRFRTQREMAEHLGFVTAHFSQMKSGNRTIGNDSADKIERGLGLPMGALDRDAASGRSDLLPSSSIQSEQSEVIFTSDNVAAPAFAEQRRWPFSPELHERIMRMGAEEIADLESSLDNHVALIEARLSRAASAGTKQSKRAS